MRQELLDHYAAVLPEAAKKERLARVSAFLSWLGNDEPSAEAVTKWIARLKGAGYADGSLLKEWGILRALFRRNDLVWPFRAGDAPIIHEQNVYAPALDPQDIAAMVDVALGRQPSQGPKPDARHKCFLALATVWGLRREEMREMTPQNVDEKQSLLFVETVKHGRQRYHVIPTFIMPYLMEWGFKQAVSLPGLSLLFNHLKEMIGLKVSMELGWHSIRRSAVSAAFDCGLNEPEVNSFYRWKRSGSNMALRYAASRVVGRSGERAEIGGSDRQLDEKVYSLHPFVKMWVTKGGQ